jgi:hypothetical protein
MSFSGELSDDRCTSERSSRLYLSGWFRYRILSKYLKPFGKDELLLDVGGGTGNVSVNFRHRFRAIVVLDRDLESVSKIQEAYLLPVVGDARQLPFKAGSFRRCLSVDFQEHLDEVDIPIYFSEAHRVLDSSGILAVFTSCRGFTIRRWLYWMVGKPPRGDLDWSDWAKDGHRNRLKAARHRQLVEESGFRLTQMRFAAHLFDPLVRRFHIVITGLAGRLFGSEKQGKSLEDGYRAGKPNALVEMYFWVLKRIAYLDCWFLGRVPGGAVFMKLEKDEDHQ